MNLDLNCIKNDINDLVEAQYQDRIKEAKHRAYLQDTPVALAGILIKNAIKESSAIKELKLQLTLLEQGTEDYNFINNTLTWVDQVLSEGMNNIPVGSETFTPKYDKLLDMIK